MAALGAVLGGQLHQRGDVATLAGRQLRKQGLRLLQRVQPGGGLVGLVAQAHAAGHPPLGAQRVGVAVGTADAVVGVGQQAAAVGQVAAPVGPGGGFQLAVQHVAV